MPNPTYRYNAHTCNYERSRLTFGSAFGYGVALLITASLMLAALLILHDFLVDSETELALRKENKALKSNHPILQQKIDEVEVILGSLKEHDSKLHEKFFTVNTTTSEERKRNSQHDVLLGDAEKFRDVLNTLSRKSNELLQKSTATNVRFADRSILGKKLKIVNQIPTRQPVENLKPESVLSGFGMRVNPFHKGLHDHPGIDIYIPRGTPVLATADGKITAVKHSYLEAGYGNYVEIEHGQGYVTRYAHLEDIHVKQGQVINKGFVIGTSGNSGGSAAPHLHYEIIYHGKNVDPILYMMEGWNSRQHEEFIIVSHQQNQSLD